MQLYDQRESPEAFGSCCSLDDLYDARRVAAALGIPALHRQLRGAVSGDRRAELRRRVRGRTHADPVRPLQRGPEVRDARRARRARFDAAAVGDRPLRARRLRRDDRPLSAAAQRRPRKGPDVFPVLADAGAARPRDVSGRPPDEGRGARARARAAGSPSPTSRTATRSASCPTATPAASSSGTLATPLPRGRGRRYERAECSARIAGVHRLTVGQRKGLGLSAGVPLYVLRLDAAEARVVVGPREELGARELTASGVNWISGEPPAEPLRVTARIRHRHATRPPRSSPTPMRARTSRSTSRRWRSRPARRWCSTTATK